MFHINNIGLPNEVVAIHDGNRKLTQDLRNVLVLYYSSCLVHLDRFFFEIDGPHLQDYRGRVKSLTPHSVIDLAAACHFHFILAYDDTDNPYPSSAGFLLYGAAYAYGKNMSQVDSWCNLAFDNPDRVGDLSIKLCQEFTTILGLAEFNSFEMLNLCLMADTLCQYSARLCASSGNLSEFAESEMCDY